MRQGLLCIVSFILLISFVMGTPLDDYIQKPDSNFQYKLVKTEVVGDVTAFIYNMTSQQWLTTAEVLQPLQWHYVTVTVPKSYGPTALFVIDGGANYPTPPSVEPTWATMASITKSIVIDLHNIPNEPFSFVNDPHPPRVEDQIIGYAWDKFLVTNATRPEWLPRMAMVKAAIRGMDLVQTEYPTIKEFVVTGASKRGWTTWLTGAVDPKKRVKAILPMVIDVLNLQIMFHHIHQVYCFWPPALKDYVDNNIPQRVDTPEFGVMTQIIDPMNYLDRLASIPKFIISSSGDQFFPPDNSQFYFDDIQGEKHILYVANTDHGLNAEVLKPIIAFYATILTNQQRPAFSWRLTGSQCGGKNILTVQVSNGIQPSIVKLWQATNPKARDFRLEAIGKAYNATTLNETAKGSNTYEALILQPQQGFTAFFIELQFPSIVPGAYQAYSTTVYIAPNTLPCDEGFHPKSNYKTCQGNTN